MVQLNPFIFTFYRLALSILNAMKFVTLVLCLFSSLCFAAETSDYYKPVSTPAKKMSLANFAGYTFGAKLTVSVKSAEERAASERRAQIRAIERDLQNLEDAIRFSAVRNYTRVGGYIGGSPAPIKLGTPLKKRYRGFTHASANYNNKGEVFQIRIIGETAKQIFDRSPSAKKRYSERDKKRAVFFEAKKELLACLADFKKMYYLESPKIRSAKMGEVLVETYELAPSSSKTTRIRKVEFVLPQESSPSSFCEIIVTDLSIDPPKKLPSKEEESPSRGWSL